MTPDEFRNEFCILYNNVMSNQAPELDDYEISVFLTKAQEQLVKAYADPNLNVTQSDFNSLPFKQHIYDKLLATSSGSAVNVKLPENIIAIYREKLDLNGKSYVIKALSNDEQDRMLSKPYPYPVKGYAWRVFDVNGFTLVVEPNINLNEGTYHITYIRKPKPIIISNIDDLKIDGLNSPIDEENPCELSEVMHRPIIQRAVELAYAAYKGDISTQIQLGSSSQTELGVVQKQSTNRNYD